MLGALTDCRAALVIAHPGHELRVFSWLRLARPCVFVLTDGSGRSGASRLHQTTNILKDAGARPGSIYGRFTDGEIYAAILNHETWCFADLAVELAAALRDEQIDYVVSDAVEGYNPAHDICHSITSAAVESLGKTGRGLQHFEVLLAQRHGSALAASPDLISIQVSPAMLTEKVQAAGNYSELASELDRIFQQEGIDAFKTEWMRRTKPLGFAAAAPPFYETYGEQQVKRGYYREIIRYREHIMPILEALQEFAAGKVRRASCGS